MTTAYESIANIRMPGYQDERWDLPANENFKILASAANNLHANIAWFSGLAATDNGSNVLGLALGVILNGNTQVNVSATTKTIPSGESHYIYSDSAGTITNSQTIPLTEITVLYFVKNNSGVLKISDLRKKGGFTLPTPSTTEEGYQAKINSSGLWATAKTYGKQQFFNGKLDHWQRATSLTVSAIAADGISTINTGTTKTFSRQAFTVGSEINGCRYYARNVVSSVAGSGNSCNMRLSIEDVVKFSNNGMNNIYLSFYAKADAAKNIAVEAQQNFGAAGSSSVNAIGSQKIMLSTAWQRYFAKFTLPSITGKTVTVGGGASYSRLDLFFWLDAGSDLNTRTATLGQQSGTFDFADIQVVAGEETFNATHYHEYESLYMAKRYYEEIDAIHDASAIYNTMPMIKKAINPASISSYTLWNQGVAVWGQASPEAIYLSSMSTAGFGSSRIKVDAVY